jgi:hypothetical protein
MNAYGIENCSIHIANGWVIGCSILTFGIITCSYLNGISDIQILHMKRKHKLKLTKLDEEDHEDNLHDNTWLIKKKDNMSPIKFNGNTISKEELAKLLAERFEK